MQVSSRSDCTMSNTTLVPVLPEEIFPRAYFVSNLSELKLTAVPQNTNARHIAEFVPWTAHH